MDFIIWVSKTKSNVSFCTVLSLFLGTGDKCKCYMYGGVLSDWESSDIPKHLSKSINGGFQIK